MIAFVWLMLATTWAGHVAALCLPASACYNFLMGTASPWTQAVVWSSLLPNVVVVPWAWRDCPRHVASARHRKFWRISFFFTGFFAVTFYALRYRARSFLPHNTTGVQNSDT